MDSPTVDSPAVDCFVEPARSYRGVAVTAALLVAGFLFDVSLGGAGAHVPGWLIAGALLLGVHALVVHAARATRSLSLDAAELRVGDGAVPRAQIIGAQPGEQPEVPVLGWPSGMPRGPKAVTVELADGRRAVVPTRDPHRLLRALGVDGHPGGPAVEIRAADPTDLPLLASIDERAGVLFEVAGMHLPEAHLPHGDALAVFVAGRPPVGFVEVDEVDGLAYVREIAVLPSAMRHGVGTRLLEQVADWARDHDLPAIALTTYADVRWNGPWYSARGFVEITEVPPGLTDIRARETQAGLDEPGRRIVMRRDL